MAETTEKPGFAHCVPGKFYVCDRFSHLKIGPFDTRREAEKERDSINIAGDCVVIQTAAPRKVQP